MDRSGDNKVTDQELQFEARLNELVADELNVENVFLGGVHYTRECPWHTPKQKEGYHPTSECTEECERLKE